MITPGQRMPIVIATKPVDFRRGHDGLAATVQNDLGLDPHSGLTVVFRSKVSAMQQPYAASLDSWA